MTGASSGIGQSIADCLRNAGWKITSPTRDDLNLAALDEVLDYSHRLRQDNKTEIAAFIHVAGLWHNQGHVLADTSFGQFTGTQISQSMNVAVTSAMLLINACLAKGQLDTVVGISGTFADGAAGWLPYYTSKRALEDFLVGLSQDEPALRVYGISPSDTATESYRTFYPQFAAEAQSPEVIGKAVLALLAGQGSVPSGSIIEMRNGKQYPGFHT